MNRLFSRTTVAVVVMSVSIAFNVTLLAGLYMAFKEQQADVARPGTDGEQLALDYYRDTYHDDDISALIETRSHLRVSVVKGGRVQKVLLVINDQVYEENAPRIGAERTGSQRGEQRPRVGR